MMNKLIMICCALVCLNVFTVSVYAGKEKKQSGETYVNAVQPPNIMWFLNPLSSCLHTCSASVLSTIFAGLTAFHDANKAYITGLDPQDNNCKGQK